MKPTQALILASGQAKRFWPLTTPKSLVKFFGQPLLFHNLRLLAKAGFTQVIITTTPATAKPISQLQISNLSIKTVIQPQPLGMADAVLSAAKLLQNTPTLIINAEDLVEQKLYQTVFDHLCRKTNFIVGKKLTSYFSGGYLKLKGTRVEAIIEKPEAGKQPSNLIKLVFDGFQKPQEFIACLKKTTSSKDDAYEQALSQMLRKHKFNLIRYNRYWQALKYPWHVLDVMKLFLETKAKSSISNAAQISPKATIKGKVRIEPGVKVFENAVIKGPAYIAKNTIIGNNVLVRESIIGADCVVGYNTEVARSWVGDNCWFHSNYIGDSVLENNISLGAGAILANLRLDEAEIHSQIGNQKISTNTSKLGAIIGSNVRVGVNTSLMPGIKIGNGTFVTSGLTIDQDIPGNSFCMAGAKLTITKNREKINASNREQFKNKLK